jgi:tetratricopeptide (TPR) repeat protein
LTLGEDDKAQTLEASRWLRPLAADRLGFSYVQVASSLNEAGRHALASEYGQAAFAMYDPDSSQFIQSAREYSESLRELEDFSTCAKVHRAANLMLLQERNLGYPLVALQHFVADAFLTQAIAEVDAGHIDTAWDCIARFEKLRPAGIEICELTYPRLVRQGQQAAADQLLERCSQRMLGHLQKWPDDAGSHNNLAWMFARCNQRLDEARQHAEIAVKLSEGAPTYIDTLAEILFRQGEIDRAIELAEQCIRLDPRHFHYRKQLDLFRTARRDQQSPTAP